MLRRIVAERWFRASAVIGLWPANSEGDDILVFADEARSAPIAVAAYAAPATAAPRGPRQCRARRFHRAARQRARRLYRRLRRDRRHRRGSRGRALQARQRRLFRDHGQGARRSARRSARRALHQRVRKEFWGYAPDEALAANELIAEKYRGIRPAPGYPAQPDHTEKATLFRLLDGERQIGVRAHRKLRDVAGRLGVRLLFQPPGKLLFRRRQDRARSSRGLCQAQELDIRRKPRNGWRRS